MFPFSEQWSGQPEVSVFPPTHQLDSARGKLQSDKQVRWKIKPRLPWKSRA